MKKDDKKIRLQVDIRCIICQKKVPGGITTSEYYFNTKEFLIELEQFKKSYLCGICRDAQRRKFTHSK